MMLRFLNIQLPTDPLRIPHRGTVVDVDDPRKLGRIRVEIKGIWELGGKVKKEHLPWVTCKNGYGLGGDGVSSGFFVPERYSEVLIEFPYGDIYAPVYTAFFQSKATHQTVFDGEDENKAGGWTTVEDKKDDYPRIYGWLDRALNFLKVNMVRGYTILRNRFSGVLVMVDESGNITIRVPTKNKSGNDNEGNLRFSIPGNAYLSVGKDVKWIVGGKMQVQVGSDMQTLVKGNSQERVLGSRNERVGSDKTELVEGDFTKTIVGSEMVEVRVDRDEVVKGNRLLKAASSDVQVDTVDFRKSAIFSALGLNSSFVQSGGPVFVQGAAVVSNQPIVLGGGSFIETGIVAKRVTLAVQLNLNLDFPD